MLDLFKPSQEFSAVSPTLELGAYEALWARDQMSFKKIAQLVQGDPSLSLADLVPKDEALSFTEKALSILIDRGAGGTGVHVRNDGSYPERLLAAEYPLQVLYYQGNWDLIYSDSVAVVGTRSPSREGGARARNLARKLVGDGYTVMSGLARGVDTEAHTAAMEAGGRTIAVLGTPVSHVYPPENAALQEKIAREHLVLSQVPFVRYARQSPYTNKLFFPERNVTMAALSQATIIVEAGETSGTLVQARAALKQGRQLFILDSCFTNPELTWPKKYQDRGAVRVSDYADIKKLLDSRRGKADAAGVASSE